MKINTGTNENQAQSRKFNIAQLTRNVSTPVFRGSVRHFGENWNPYSAVIKKLYASKEVKENALAPEGKSCRPENNNYSQSI